MAIARRSVVALGVRELAWRYPEWWTLAASLVAWAFLWLRAASSPHHHVLSELSAARPWPGLADEAAMGLAMILAMMVPLMILQLRAVAFRSMWNRRHLAMAEFLCGYVATWTAAYLGLRAASLVTWPGAMPLMSAAVVLLAAAIWQMTPEKRRALRACPRIVPLAPDGWAAHRDRLRYGARTARACIVSCWILMLVPLVLPTHLVPMIGVAIICGAERYARRAAREPALLALILVAAAAGCAAVGLTAAR